MVFAPGFDLFPNAYSGLLQSWARHGYVVAAPTFPLTNPGAIGGLDEADIVNQPADVTFVIRRILAAARRHGSFLSGMVDPSEVAVAGHSDGGETALAAAEDTCCRDRRVRAVIVIAGAELHFPGTHLFPPGAPPLLAVQGTADRINLPWNSDRIYAQAPGPKDYLVLLGGGHFDPFTGRYGRITAAVTLDFLDLYLKHLPGADQRLAADGRSDPALERLHRG